MHYGNHHHHGVVIKGPDGATMTSQRSHTKAFYIGVQVRQTERLNNTQHSQFSV